MAAHEYWNYIEGCEQEDTTVFVLGNGIPTTVHFALGTGLCADTSKTETEAGAGVTLPQACSCASGYEFAGWTTSPVCSETTVAPDPLYQPGETYYPMNNDTL